MTAPTTTPSELHPEKTALTEADLALILRLHGHLCPGVLLGARQAKVAAAFLRSRGGDGRVFAFYRGRACALDGIQLFSGCTWGNGNLVLLRGNDFTLHLFLEEEGRGVMVKPLPDLLREIRAKEGEAPASPLKDRIISGGETDLFLREEAEGAPALTRYPGDPG